MHKSAFKTTTLMVNMRMNPVTKITKKHYIPVVVCNILLCCLRGSENCSPLIKEQVLTYLIMAGYYKR